MEGDMKRLSLIASVVFLLVVVAALSASASPPAPESVHPGGVTYGANLLTPTVVPTCAPSWAIVGSPEVGGRGANLASVDSVSSTDIWAVGSAYTERPSHRKRSVETRQVSTPGSKGESQQAPNVTVLQTLIEHWDGTQWAIVPSPNVGADDNTLLMLDAVSATDVWAVGYYVNDFGISQTLVQHYNGTVWSVVSSPNTGGLLDNRLLSVEAVSAIDVWAVGYYYDDSGVARTLTEHYDGTAWGIIASPNNGDETQNNYLHDLAVVSSGDIWAAGSYINANGIPRSLLLRWNGTQWSTVASPGIGSGANALLAIDASSATDVWAVGYYATASYTYRALTQHWDGTQWTVVANPNDLSGFTILYGVETVSATDAWAVGASGYSGSSVLHTLHWDGAAWTMVRAVNVQEYFGYTFYGVDVVGTNDVWAVGGSSDYYAPEPIIEHYSRACLTCSTRFVDVPEGSTFYNSIQCLACQGLVGGYPPAPPPINTAEPYPTPAPTSTAVISEFHPNYNITRGQLAKIVSNSAGFNDDPGPQLFQDVDSYYYYSPFYVWINRLAKRGIVAGYPCGGEGEPCGYNNLPYFRTNNEATRGQIAKIVSVAAEYSETHTDQGFADVPLTHQFYQWIARLYSRGLIGGYPCGSPGEPCDSQNRPYFRPDANATRGQVTKIVAKGFFPNCYVP